MRKWRHEARVEASKDERRQRRAPGGAREKCMTRYLKANIERDNMKVLESGICLCRLCGTTGPGRASRNTTSTASARPPRSAS
eukprot:8794449-Pyramimonas_sp.AAC.1